MPEAEILYVMVGQNGQNKIVANFLLKLNSLVVRRLSFSMFMMIFCTVLVSLLTYFDPYPRSSG